MTEKGDREREKINSRMFCAEVHLLTKESCYFYCFFSNWCNLATSEPMRCGINRVLDQICDTLLGKQKTLGSALQNSISVSPLPCSLKRFIKTMLPSVMQVQVPREYRPHILRKTKSI